MCWGPSGSPSRAGSARSRWARPGSGESHRGMRSITRDINEMFDEKILIRISRSCLETAPGTCRPRRRARAGQRYVGIKLGDISDICFVNCQALVRTP